MKKESIAYFENILTRYHNGEKITRGENAAYRAFERSRNDNQETLVLYEFIWADQYADFANAIKASGTEYFIITDHSTALMEMLHGFAENGLHFDGLTHIERQNLIYVNETEKIQGIRIKVAE